MTLDHGAPLRVGDPAIAALIDREVDTGLGHGLALSPDGTRIVYASDQRLYLRALDTLGAVAIPGTEEGTQPFFSPDGERLGFAAGGSLKKFQLRGGGATTIAAVAGDASWTRDGSILVGAGRAGVLRVPAGGGEVVPLVAPQAGFNFGMPQALPDGRSFLYGRWRWGDARPETFVRSLDRDDLPSVTEIVEPGNKGANALHSSGLPSRHGGAL